MFFFSAISHIYCVVVGAWQHSWLNANNLFEYLLISCAVQHSNFHVLPTTCYATHPSWYTVYVCLAFICFDCVRKFISENLFVLWSIVQCIFMFFLNGRIKKMLLTYAWNVGKIRLCFVCMWSILNCQKPIDQ